MRSAAAFVLIAAASLIAQPVVANVPFPGQTLPSYAQPSSEQTISGRITAIVDAFHITVRDENGYDDNVQLHRGTVINPTGLTLAVGMSVTIVGYNAGSVFEANQIDTPYRWSDAPPAPFYYGPGWWYPGYVYGYGPSFTLVIGAGGALVRKPFPHPHPFLAPPYPPPWNGGHYVGQPRPHPERPGPQHPAPQRPPPPQQPVQRRPL